MKESAYSPSRSAFSPIFSPTKLGFSWPPSLPILIPHRFRRKLRSRIRSRQSPSSSLTSLQTSFKPSDTLRSLRGHRWSYYDAHYLFLIILLVFALSMIERPGALAKTAVATLLLTSLILPITRQFFLPFLPIATWLIFFYSCQFVPGEWRPHIWVKVLPALENIFYGANLSNILSAHQNSVLDLLAWFPYGITHFGAPFVCSGIMFIFGPPGTVSVFARSFGYMNIIGVMIQMLFPCSPPWYENLYGLAPANYSIAGSPAGLARLDQLFGLDMYTSTFTASPMVFGAFPSLHSGCATIEALFMSHVFPQLQPLFIAYTLWLWWATMYLSHHYAVDLVAGSLLSGAVFFVAKAKFLPRLQHDKKFRWDYDFTEIGDKENEYALLDAEKDLHIDNEDWTIGSSSSISSGPDSPVDETQSLWEGETLASVSDTEAQR
ncbi:Aureobasidin resistance protein Aur1 [Varicellaria rhodocarpa]|nr:Aureobasidin resistance protein Aur1 [Varicellaria rhodocarpa]